MGERKRERGEGGRKGERGKYIIYMYIFIVCVLFINIICAYHFDRMRQSRVTHRGCVRYCASKIPVLELLHYVFLSTDQCLIRINFCSTLYQAALCRKISWHYIEMYEFVI